MLMKKEHVILALILVLAFILRLYGVIVDVDFFFREATDGIAAWRIVDGDMIYCDFTHPQAPLTPFLFALVFLIFGVGIVQARLFIVFFTTFFVFRDIFGREKDRFQNRLAWKFNFCSRSGICILWYDGGK